MSPIAAIGKHHRLKPLGKVSACVFAPGFAAASYIFQYLARLG